MNNNQFKKEAWAERDARWLFGLISIIFVLIGWFWQPISKMVSK